MAWKTRIIQIKEIPANSTIGYDRTFKTYQSMRIAVLPIGYFDGYSRSLSNKGHVIIRQQAAPIVGLVSMNLMCVDITNIPDTLISDEVTLLGNYETVSASNCAKVAGLITNQVITGINSNIPRIIVNQIEQINTNKTDKLGLKHVYS